jgi:hypothetical protein
VSKKHYPSTLDRALAGDNEALEHVLEGIVAPLFDLAFHALGEVSEARAACAATLEALAEELRGGRSHHRDPLVHAAALFWRGQPATSPGRSLVLEPSSTVLSSRERRAALTVLVVDLEGEDLARALGISQAEAEKVASAAALKLGGHPEGWRDRLNQLAAATPMPPGMLDFLDE